MAVNAETVDRYRVIYTALMPSVKRVRPSEIFTPAELQSLGAISTWQGLLQVSHAWGVIGFVLAACAYSNHPLVWILAVPIIGGRQLGLAILMHDAAHGLLHPNRKINDFVGRWFCGEPIGASLSSYRAYHFQHHKYTQQLEDPDLILSAPFPVSPASLRRKFFRDLSGQTFYKQRLSIAAGPLGQTDGRSEQASLEAKRAGRRFLGGSLAVFALIVLAGNPLIFLIWAVALMSWFQLAIRVRNIAEHALTNTGEDPFTHARTTLTNVVGRALLAPYWVNYHAEHHLFAWIPCYRLGQAHQILRTRGHMDKMTIAPTYSSVLRQVSSSA